ncbi:MAG: hypothetical protein ACI4Q3_05060 [Kiritimatiellia bacterium]
MAQAGIGRVRVGGMGARRVVGPRNCLNARACGFTVSGIGT